MDLVLWYFMLLISSVHVALISGAQIVAHLSTAFLIKYGAESMLSPHAGFPAMLHKAAAS